MLSEQITACDIFGFFQL